MRAFTPLILGCLAIALAALAVSEVPAPAAVSSHTTTTASWVYHAIVDPQVDSYSTLS